MKNRCQTGQRTRGRKLEQSVLQLRQLGYGYVEVAQACGCSVGGAHKACARAIARLEQQCDGEARDLRRLQLLRLDHALVKLAPLIEDGQLSAIDRLVRVLERQARLFGLITPEQTRSKVDVHASGEQGPSDEDLAKMTREEMLAAADLILRGDQEPAATRTRRS